MLPMILAALSIAAAFTAAGAADIDFEREVRPLLMQRCGACHGPDEQNGGLRLDARHFAFKGGAGGEVIVPSNSAASELIRRITSNDPDERMPPDSTRLPDSEIDILARWINRGADWPESDYDRDAKHDRRLEHWAFQPLRPDSNSLSASEGRNTIDRFVHEKLKDHGLAPSPEADRRTLIRRLSFDMLGLPPTIDEVTAFEADDDPRAWDKLVDKMLKSPRYGERWAQHWLDVIRYADTHGFEVNTPRENAWPYRDYVIRSFNEDKPYDQFILEQLAGDGLDADEATGFLVAAAVLLPEQIGKDDKSKRLARQDALDEIIQGTGATLLGLTIGCARCHDHKFDPLSQRDYYAMQAFFAGVEYGDRAINSPDREERLARAAAISPRISELERKLDRCGALAFRGRTIIIDEQNDDRVTFFKPANGPGRNPAGTKRGYQEDVGSAERVGNLSRGQYTWWDNVPGEDVLSYAPGVRGRFRLWLSWGAHGSGVHTRDARYILDQDGDPTSQDDQREIARVDQHYLAGVTAGEMEKKPLWSGLLNVGVVDLIESTKLLLRGGEAGTGITADVIVLQEVDESLDDNDRTSPLPRLRSPINPLRNDERFPPVTARFVRFTSLETVENNRHEPCIDELEIFAASDPARNVALAASGAKATSSGNYSESGKHQLRHVNDGRYGNDHSWISNQRGTGWVQIELAEPTAIERVAWGRDRNGKFTDRLATRYTIEVSQDGQSWQRVAGPTDRVPIDTPHDSIQELLRNRPADSDVDLPALVAEIDRLKTKKRQLEAPRMVYGGTFRTPDRTYVLRRGDPEQRLQEIEPAVPSLFNVAPVTASPTEYDRRLALARWIASPDNPLTARVMVNRLWMYHFGQGIVATPSDFGLNGARPSHPELLDWLAGEFIRSGWSIKHMHRLILTSQTYRQSHRIDRQAAMIDRDNRWLARFVSRRLEAEAIRDSMLAVSGELNLKMGGTGFSFFKSRGGLSGFPAVEEFGPEQLRRMIYSHKIRMEPVPVFGAFDCPDAGQATPLRSQSTTAIQALNLFNSRFVADRAEKFASRIQTADDDGVERQVATAFRLALGREPRDAERRASVDVVSKHGLATLCRVLFNCNEFLFMP